LINKTTELKKKNIGILINSINQLANWELEIIAKIFTDPALSISLLIEDGRKSQGGIISKIKNTKSFIGLLAKCIFEIQRKIESKIFRTVEYDYDNVKSKLAKVKKIVLKPKRKGFLDYFSENDAEKIKKYDLDIILWHGFNIIRGPILNIPKNGIWSFHHGDNAINRGGPTGFWEIIENRDNLGVTLQKLKEELDGGYIIDKSFYNIHWSCVKNANDLRMQSVTLLFKNLEKLKNGNISYEESKVYDSRLFRNPGIYYISIYLLKFYFSLIKKILDRILYTLLSVRTNCWTLYIGNGNFIKKTLYKLKSINLPKGVFYADPFLCKYKNENYIFFEKYNYKEKKGVISCGLCRGNELVNVKDVLIKPYHLSYPTIIHEDGEVFMIPECSGNKRLEIYKCKNFPDKWDLYSTAFEGEEVADVNYYRDDKGERWIFLNRGFNNNHNNELYLYRIDSLKFEKIEEHKSNPVIIDSRIGRNAGAIFKYKDKIIRPSQNNSKGVYGYSLNLNEIINLTIDDYSEEKFISVEPNFDRNLKGIHHLHQIEDKFVFDACLKIKV